MNERVVIVIPTVRSLSFLKEWQEEFRPHTILVVEDNPTRQINLPPGVSFRRYYHYDWSDIRADFGNDEWIIPRRNAGIRSYGFWKAYTMGADVIITIDDDCFPTGPGFVDTHLENLRAKAPNDWFATFPHPSYMYTRGFPYGIRDKMKTVISHGLWSNKMDMDAKTQLAIGDVDIPAYPPMRQYVPGGMYFPMSSMNLAFVRDVTPLMYFFLMGQDPDGNRWGYDRYDDIWAGIAAKKVCDAMGYAVANGSPFVEHRKASDSIMNRKKERTGMKLNEEVWKGPSLVRKSGESLLSLYERAVRGFRISDTTYKRKLVAAVIRWVSLFRKV